MKNNNYIWHMSYLRNSIAYDHGFCYTCIKWWSVQVCFNIFIFWAVMGVKGQKMAQDDEKLCLFYLMPQEPYIIWLSYIADLCKMMISSGVFFFFIFSKFWFFGLLRRGDKRAKNCPKWERILSVMLNISGIIHHVIFIYGSFLLYSCVKWQYLWELFSFFQNFDFPVC